MNSLKCIFIVCHLCRRARDLLGVSFMCCHITYDGGNIFNSMFTTFRKPSANDKTLLTKLLMHILKYGFIERQDG